MSFTCSLCRETFRVDYHGRKPPFCPELVFMEDVFCMMDPFSGGVQGEGGDGAPRRCLPTVLGGTCANCSRSVCARCSLFYAVRMCGQCAREHKTSLPKEVWRMVDATEQRWSETKPPLITSGSGASSPAVAIDNPTQPNPP
ncbi:unnamed protein product [Ascophyllum nodosum]